MSRAILGYGVVPIVMFGGYFACLAYLPWFSRRILHTEHGLIEWGTALAFFLAAVAGVILLVKSRRKVPSWCRVLFGLFVAAAMFVALEETSYGQKLFLWESPSWFAENNSKAETNLHNMFGNKPSNRLRAIATVGCPLVCIVFPILARLRRTMEPGCWQYYLLPRDELLVLAALTLVLTVFNKIPAIRQMASWTGHLGELKELIWGIIAFCYARILSRRFDAAVAEQSHLPATLPIPGSPRLRNVA